MYLRFVVLLFSLCCCGFMLETPESIREEQRAIREWHSQIKKHYDLKALHRFLVEQIKNHPTIDGIQLSKAKISRGWKSGGMALVSGDWIFSLDPPDSDTFTLTWTYERIPDKENSGGIESVIRLKCTRTSKSKFVLQISERSDDEYVILIP